ncbi:hypothetical protein DPMN_141914 [Dreissena polymorpha]|uniref:Myb/SANT-like DNA-binding domain-containing protein n=1 Tax=Dreissena polymorpha TaxID=45954 RepID=A0A9D4JIQ7_DREPO|nr:hypothetical protein DPMN_141914 [Dreissena polymorpha]
MEKDMREQPDTQTDKQTDIGDFGVYNDCSGALVYVGKTFVVQLINDRYDELYCRFKGATLGGKKKEQTWQEVADTFNSSSVAQCSRTVRQIKDMYAQLKCRAKKKSLTEKKLEGGLQLY